MGIKEILGGLLGRDITESDIAGHYADRISALEQNRTSAMCEGNTQLMGDFTKKIIELRQEARDNGLDRNRYPGLYR